MAAQNREKLGRIVPPVGPQVQAVHGRGGHAPQPGGKAVGRSSPGGIGAGKKGDAMALLSDDVHGISSCELKMIFYFSLKHGK